MYQLIELSTEQAKQIAYDWYDVIIKTIEEERTNGNEKNNQ